MDLGISDTGMVVDHGVHKRISQQRIVMTVAAGTGCGCPVAAAGRASDEPPATTIGDVAQLFDIDMNQRSGMRMLVAADHFPGADVDVGQPFNRHRTSTACTVEAGTRTLEAIACGDRRLRQRRSTILRTIGAGVRFGLRCGRLERSLIPAAPISR